MLFNSVQFAIFLIVVFVLYWFVTNRNLKAQNMLLLVSSYFFYGMWDWRFLGLLVFSTLLDYYSGLKMDGAQNQRIRKFWFWLSITLNLGFLATFKYFNFFADSFAKAFSQFGLEIDPLTLNVILPVGISFYTFHGLSYVIDIYKNTIKPERSFIEYAVFVSFFPLLVAGPIERATHLLPQIQKVRLFDVSQAISGLKQILWGLVKKVIIADQCAEYVNMVFDNAGTQTGSTLLLGAILFAFQIYGDFSGYSDIALGTARLFGIDLLKNFAFPYFSRDIAEFWRRWHISLSSWFRDYLYVPLGGSKGGMWLTVRNTFIIFLVSGFWHGANWTFIVWGLLNAIMILPSIIVKTNRKHLEIVAKGKWFPSLHEAFSIVITFVLTVFAWIFFRAENLSDAFAYIKGIGSESLLSIPTNWPGPLIYTLLAFIFIEWSGREGDYALARFGFNWPRSLRWSFYYMLCFMLFYYSGSGEQFIYFQF